MLLIHRAQRVDALVAALAAGLATATGDPFQPEVVAVPSKGVERWLAQRLSHVLGAQDDDGVCANVAFPSYARLLDDTLAEADAGYAAAIERWMPERSIWPLMRVIDECAPGEPWAGVLAAHLGLDGSADKGRRFAVAGKLARLYDRYGRSRPDLIKAWAAGRDEQGSGEQLPLDLAWQAELWRRQRAAIGVSAPAELLDDACTKIAPGPDFSIFGATRISPTRIHVLVALAQTRDVHLWLHHPSPALWNAVNHADERPGRRRAQKPVVKHPLLASMSRDVRELQQLLNGHPYSDQLHVIASRPGDAITDTLLGRLQAQLAGDDVPAVTTPISVDDHSIQIHAAHGPVRQVEVLREALLQLFGNDPTLEPRDVLIMCPDVEAFAPLVAASFGMADEPGGHPAARLRVALADRSLRQTNPLLSLLSQLLELAAGRVTATQLLDFAGAQPVRRLFGFDDDDMERLRHWTVTAGARWGLDADHRKVYDLGRIGQGTWRDAIDRVLVGVAMQDDSLYGRTGAWVGDTLPLDDVDSGDIELAGRFAELVDRLDHAVRALGATHSVAQWARLLDECITTLGEGEQPWQLAQLRRELDEAAESAADTDIVLGLADLTALLHTRLAGRPTRGNFRTGSLTVCTLVPMRSVPHRVVCLIGMDDGAFPRQTLPDGDDVLARDPRTGERDPRSEDRQLFLDAVCAAQDHLVLAYTGANPRTGEEVPPCVPLSELMDAIDAGACSPSGSPAREHVVVHHPLQPFDSRNFRAGELGSAGPFSFDPAGLAGARAATRPRIPAPPLVSAPLPPLPPTETVSLDELVRFFQHPVKGFLRQRLGISTAMGDDEPVDALTVELAGLQGWAVGERVVRSALAGVDPAVLSRLERLRGELPPGPLGSFAWHTIGRRVDALLAASTAQRQTPGEAVDIAVGLDDGRMLAGTVPGVHRSPGHGDASATILSVSYSTLAPKHRIAAWIRYLAAVATDGPTQWRAVTVGRKGDKAQASVLCGLDGETARSVLHQLVTIRDAGLREPLPLVLATSAEYASRRQRGASSSDALPGAQQRWVSDKYAPERNDPEHVLVYGPQADLDRLTDAAAGAESFDGESTRFGALARLVWTPLLTVETS